MKKIFFCFIIITSFFVGCKKDYSSIDEPVKIPNLKTMPGDSLLGNRVKTMIIGLLELSVDSNFVSIVNYEVSKQFDDDDNVMLSTLVDVSNENKIDLIALMDQSVNSYENDLPNAEHSFDYYNSLSGQTNISNIIDGFEIDEINYYLQIYIPFADQVNLQDTPIICFGHQEIETTIGYKLNSDNSISVFEVDEEFAENNLIWIVSANESVDKNGVYDRLANVPSTINSSDFLKSTGRSLEVNQVKINETKESWLNGKAEVAYVAVILSSWNNCTVKSIHSDHRIVKIKKADIKTWIDNASTRNILAANISPYQLVQNNDLIALVMYEKDVNGNNTQNVCTGTNLSFKSQNTMYGYTTFLGSDLPTTSGTWDTNFIKTWSNQDSGIRFRCRRWL